MNSSRWATPLAALLLVSLTTRAAAADPSMQQCTAAFEDGQRSQMCGDLKLALSKFESCTAPQCPALVQRECARLLGVALEATPTVEFELQFADGAAKRPVSLAIDDGEPEVYDGQLLRVNPGKHRFVFACEGCVTVSRRISFAESDHKRKQVGLNAPIVEPEVIANRSSSVPDVLSAKALKKDSAEPGTARDSALPARSQLPATRVPAPHRALSSRDALMLSGGALLVGLSGVGFVSFGLEARSGERSLASCAPECSAARIARVKRDYWLANASLATGLVALAGTSIWWFAGRPKDESARARSANGGQWSVTLGAFSTVTRTF